MLRVYSFTQGAIRNCPQILISFAKGNGTSLRHITLRVRVIGQRLEPANSLSFRTLSQSKSHQTIKQGDSSQIMSDDAYSSFLDQANQDTGASKVSTKSKSAATKAVDSDVPVTLQKVDQYYVSESDEPFEPVSLKWNGKNMPSESMKPRQAPCSGARDT